MWSNLTCSIHSCIVQYTRKKRSQFFKIITTDFHPFLCGNTCMYAYMITLLLDIHFLIVLYKHKVNFMFKVTKAKTSRQYCCFDPPPPPTPPPPGPIRRGEWRHNKYIYPSIYSCSNCNLNICDLRWNKFYVTVKL